MSAAPTPTYSDVHVCEDCYISHHYGARPVDADEIDQARTASGFPHDLTADDPVPPLWWVGEGDVVTAVEPLGKIGEDVEVTDNTCSNHGYGDDGFFTVDEKHPCPHCYGTDEDDGITEFTWSGCHGCGSHLGGSRHRLAVWDA